MRTLFALFAFLALLIAPLGSSPVAASGADHCAEMAGMDHGRPQPQQDHGGGPVVKSCCTAVAAALPAAGEMIEAPALRAPLVAPALPAQHGVRREVEVPPPRA